MYSVHVCSMYMYVCILGLPITKYGSTYMYM